MKKVLCLIAVLALAGCGDEPNSPAVQNDTQVGTTEVQEDAPESLEELEQQMQAEWDQMVDEAVNEVEQEMSAEIDQAFDEMEKEAAAELEHKLGKIEQDMTAELEQVLGTLETRASAGTNQELSALIVPVVDEVVVKMHQVQDQTLPNPIKVDYDNLSLSEEQMQNHIGAQAIVQNASGTFSGALYNVAMIDQRGDAFAGFMMQGRKGAVGNLFKVSPQGFGEKFPVVSLKEDGSRFYDEEGNIYKLTSRSQ